MLNASQTRETVQVLQPQTQAKISCCVLAEHIALRDDIARLSPGQKEVTLDVISNDNLKGANAADVKLSVVTPPAVGTVTVLPAEGKNGHPKLLYKQGKDKLEPGTEVEVFYTAVVPGHPTPSPAVAMLLGAGECCCSKHTHGWMVHAQSVLDPRFDAFCTKGHGA